MRRYLRLWLELLVVLWRRQRLLMAGLLAVEIGGLVAAIGAAVAMGAAIGAAISGSASGVLAAAGAVALVSTISVVVRGLGPSLMYRAVSQASDVQVDPQIVSDVATIEGIEHLERGDVLARVTLLRNAAWGVVASAWSAVQAASMLVRLATVVLLLGWVSPWMLALMPAAFVPLWCDKRGRAMITRAETETAEQFALQRHFYELATSASAGKELRVAGAARELARRQLAAWDETTAVRYRAQQRASALRMAGWSIFVVGFLLCLAATIGLRHTGEQLASQVVVAIAAAVALQQSVSAAVYQVTGTLGASRVIEPYLWLREYAAAQRPPAVRAAVPDRLRDGISLRGVGFTYPGGGHPALKDITVDLPAGSVVAIVGEYGSGKTTLVKLLGKFYRPTRGDVCVDGVNLADIDTAAWRARTSAVYQDFGRYPQTTVAESVGIGDVAHVQDRARVAAAIRDANAEAFVERLPDGLDTMLSRAYDGVDLSEGQWQKTALARANMRTDPLLLVLDEPTASIDAPSEHEIVKRYAARARDLAVRTGAITIIVTHRFSTVANADLILVMAKGELVECGTHDDLMVAGGQYSRLYNVQAAAYQLASPR